MRKKNVILFSLIFILSIISVNLLNTYLYNVIHSSNSINIEIENKNRQDHILFKNSDLQMGEGNITKIKIISLSDPGGKLSLDPYYTSYIGNNLSINFYLYDINNSNIKVIDEENQANISIYYSGRDGLIQTGLLESFITFNNESQTFIGIIETANIDVAGNYSIQIHVELLGYEIETRSIRITLLERLNLDVLIFKPNQVVAGEKFFITVKVGIIENDTFFPLEAVLVNIRINLNNKTSVYNYNLESNQNGIISNAFIIPLDTKYLSLNILIFDSYYYNGESFTDLDIILVPYREYITNFTSNLILLIFFIIVFILIPYLFFKKKKERKRKALYEFMQLFNDILKVEHVFIIYKKSNHILMKKSYTSKEFNSELMNKYTTFIFSSKNTTYPQNFKETTINSKILLKSEGNYLIFGIILKNKTTNIFKHKLSDCIDYIENNYRSELLNNNIKHNSFKEIGNIFEDRLNISLNSLHYIESGKAEQLLISKSYSIILYSIINDFIRKRKQNYFYLSEILSEFTKQTDKGILEFLLGIKELKDKYKIAPIKNNI